MSTYKIVYFKVSADVIDYAFKHLSCAEFWFMRDTVTNKRSVHFGLPHEADMAILTPGLF